MRRRPYSVVLLDEIEKAHPDVFNTLLQVLDDGRLTDNKGRVANFKNTIIIMTTNVGSHLIHEALADLDKSDRTPAIEKTKSQVFELLSQTMRPEFLNRIDEIIMFNPLSPATVRQVVAIQWQQVQEQLKKNGISLVADEHVIEYLAREGYNPQFGARPMKRLIQRKILNELSQKLLTENIGSSGTIQITLHNREQIKFINDTSY